MEGTLRLMAWLQRHAGPWGAAGSGLLFAHWNGLARDIAAPAAWSVTLQLAAAVTLTVGVVGLQLAQGTHPASWVGWSGAAALGMGFWTSLGMVCAGLVLVGACVVRCRVHRASTGAMLAFGGAMLLFTTAFAPGFGSDNSVPMSIPWLLLMDAGLVLVAGAMADLALAQREQRPASAA
jgi:hypothetical protein